MGRLLGRLEGFVSVGEVWLMWEKSFWKNEPCNCGEPFKSCPFWSRIVRRAYGGADAVDGRSMDRKWRTCMSVRHVPALLSRRKTRRYRRRLEDYTRDLLRFYRAVKDVTRCEYIVDASKVGFHGLVLSNMPQIELSVVHLVRDSRAVAYSERRRRRRIPLDGYQDAGFLIRRSPVNSAARWIISHGLVRTLRGRSRHYDVVRYEDFTRRPQQTLNEIVAKICGLERPPGPVEGNTVTFENDHVPSGNPSRFQMGRVDISPDVEWRRKMPHAARAIVTGMTFPLLIRYGYEL